MKYQKYLLASIVILLTITSCAPVFSDLQSARTAGANRLEITPSTSKTSMTANSSKTDVQSHIGVQVAYGLGSRVDVRLRYERISLINYFRYPGLSYPTTFNVIGFGLKGAIIPKILSLNIPVGREMSSSGKESWEIQPTLLITAPIAKDKVELTIAPKLVYELQHINDHLVACNIGLALSSDLNKWALRPEYGMLFSTESNSSIYYSHFSLGLTFYLGNGGIFSEVNSPDTPKSKIKSIH